MKFQVQKPSPKPLKTNVNSNPTNIQDPVKTNVNSNPTNIQDPLKERQESDTRKSPDR
jgi:hypothetical protein